MSGVYIQGKKLILGSQYYKGQTRTRVPKVIARFVPFLPRQLLSAYITDLQPFLSWLESIIEVKQITSKKFFSGVLTRSQ